ncbi:septation protein IspZ [Phenylobacterium sp.]|uniref:septation protein IspZ n=1 Tax=Phenylobacterium sp. TaxID=1871053 RepID=UPI002F3FC0EC
MKDLIYAIRPLASDFLSSIVLAVLLAMHVDVRTATGAALLVGIGQVVFQKATHRPVELLQWASLGLVVVLGGVAMMTNDPRFLMIKPSIIYVAIGVVMLKKGWMIRYLPDDAVHLVSDLMVGWGYVWSGLMFTTAIANLVIAWLYPAWWPAFLAVFPLASKLTLFAVHFGSAKYIGHRRHARLMAAEVDAGKAAEAQTVEAAQAA